jgi:hypothetical protein
METSRKQRIRRFETQSPKQSAHFKCVRFISEKTVKLTGGRVN